MGIDPRGPRFAALITTVVLAVVLITGGVLRSQALVLFAAGSVFGLRYSPYGLLYRRLIRGHGWARPANLEPESPPRFAQAVGLVFAIAGVAGYAGRGRDLAGGAGPPRAAALAAAFLNGAFGYCLGCEMYLLIRRIWPGRQALAPATADKEA